MSWSHPQHSPADSAIWECPDRHDSHPHAHPSVQQAFVPRHLSNSFSNRLPSPSTNPGPSFPTHSTPDQLGFDSQQVEGSISPDVGMQERAVGYGEFVEYTAAQQSYGYVPALPLPFWCMNPLLYAR